MAIRVVKFDEDLSPMVAAPMRAAGIHVATVVDQGWSGLKDDDLWTRVIAEGCFFVTADKGFADVRMRPPGSHPGILLLRPDRESVLDFRALVESVITEHDLNSLSGTVAVATPRGVRVRRPIRLD